VGAGIVTAYMATKRLLFVDKNDKKQLEEIVRCFGELPPDVEKLFRHEPRFTNVQPFTAEDVVPLATRLTEVTQSVFQVIERCLQLSPAHRPTCV